MSWSIEEHIGECRPFPAQVIVYKGETDECMAYVSGKVADKLKAENAKLREQLDWERSENGWMREFNDRMAEHCGTKDCPSLVAYVNKIETENAKLRELTKDMFNCIRHANEQDWFYFNREETGCGLLCTFNGEECGLLVLADRMRELGIEVDE